MCFSCLTATATRGTGRSNRTILSRGGNEPPAEMNDRPEQNIGYDEAVKGAPLTAEERDRAKRESPLSD